jgi:hypothetical protein
VRLVDRCKTWRIEKKAVDLEVGRDGPNNFGVVVVLWKGRNIVDS